MWLERLFTAACSAGSQHPSTSATHDIGSSAHGLFTAPPFFPIRTQESVTKSDGGKPPSSSDIPSKCPVRAYLVSRVLKSRSGL